MIHPAVITTRPEPEVTIIVTPREKWSACRRPLDGVAQHTTFAYRLIYMDGGSPPRVRRHIAHRARGCGFELIRTNRYLSPDEARLMGLEKVTTEHTVFMDDDVVVAPGWMEAMLDCARATGAAVVSPLVC